MPKGRQAVKHPQENPMLQRAGRVPGMDREGLEVGPAHVVIEKFKGLLRRQAPTLRRRPAPCGEVGAAATTAAGIQHRLAQDPFMLLQLAPRGERIGQPVKLMVERAIKANQPLQVRADHHHRRNQVAVFLPLGIRLPVDDGGGIELGHAQFQHQVGQQFALAQRTPQEL